MFDNLKKLIKPTVANIKSGKVTSGIEPINKLKDLKRSVKLAALKAPKKPFEV